MKNFVFDYTENELKRVYGPDTNPNFAHGAPIIPIKLIRKNRKIDNMYYSAVVDSGSEMTTFPIWLIENLDLDIQRENFPMMTAIGNKDCYSTTIPGFIVEKNNRKKEFLNLKVLVAERNNEIEEMTNWTPIILGRKPLFDLFKVTIIHYKKRIILSLRI